MKVKVESPMEQRLVFVQYIRRQRCRYNPSFGGLLELPPIFREKVIGKWKTRNPKAKLPVLDINLPPKKAKK